MFQSALLIITLQIFLTSTQDLKSIFQIPSRRNYDDFEILERSSFGKDDAGTPSTDPSNPPSKTAYANAQVLVRFGGDPEKSKCACGDVCQCGKNIPYIIPVYTPIPYCYCTPPTSAKPLSLPISEPPPIYYVYAPHTHVEPLPSRNPLQNENVVDETPDKDEEVNNNNHPEILGTVELSNDIIKPLAEDTKKIKCLEEVSHKLNPTEISPNVKFVSLDLSKLPPPDKNDVRNLKDCLVPYSTPKQKLKLLLTYPIFNKPKNKTPPTAKQTPVEHSQSGYSYSGGSGYYSDPIRTVIYRRPTIITIVGPQRSEESVKYVPIIEPEKIARKDENVKYVLVPVTESINTPPTTASEDHSEDCCCCSCAKYAGELNEKS